MRALIIAIMLACCAATGVQAKAIEEKNLVSGKVRLDPALGYIFLQGEGRKLGSFVRVPDAEDVADYQKEWEKQFAIAQKRYARQVNLWKSDVAIASKTGKPAPEKPAPPTPETFSIGEIEQRTMVTFGPIFSYAKDSVAKKYSYLTEVKPGKYIWYGPVLLNTETGYTGVCYCMGSLQFDVKPGAITDLGDFLDSAPLYESHVTAEMNDIRASGGLNGFRISLPDASRTPRFGVPASLNALPSVQAEFSAAGKMNNFLGVSISRLPPVPGILAYDRDTVIDVRTGTRLKAERLREQVRR